MLTDGETNVSINCEIPRSSQTVLLIFIHGRDMAFASHQPNQVKQVVQNLLIEIFIGSEMIGGQIR